MSGHRVEDEIDLMDLAAKGYRAFRKNIVLFIVLPLTGLGIALLISYSSSDKYSSSMMIETDLLTSNEANFIINELDETDSIPGISKKRDKELIDLKFEVAGSDQNVYIKVTAYVTNPRLFPYLEKIIVNYLNGTRPVYRMRQDRGQFYRNMIKEIDDELGSIEEIKKQTDAKTIAAYLSPSDLFAKTVELQEKRAQYEMNLRQISTVHVVKGFQSLAKDAKLKKPIVAIIGFIVGGLTALIIVFLKSFNNYYKSLDSPGGV